MALGKESFFYGVADLKIFPITADTASTYTLGDGIDIPGVKNFSVEPNIDSKTLSGDEKDMAVVTKIKSFKFSAEHAKLSLDALKALQGGRITATGETQQKYSFQDGDKPEYFQLQASVTDADVGSVTLVLYKCKIESYPVAGKEGDFSTFSFSGTAVFPNKTFDRGSCSKSLPYEIIFDSTVTTLTGITT